MPRVTLTTEDMGAAVVLARDRWMEALRSKRQDSVFAKDWFGDFDSHLKGAVGEIAYAKWSNQYQRFSLNRFHGGGDDTDIGNVAVRYRRNPGHDLILRRDDPSDLVYVLVRGTPPDVEIAGWIRGEDARSELHLRDYGGHGEALFVPVNYLRKMEDLS